MTLRKISTIFAIYLCAASVSSCDDGDIYDEHYSTNTDGYTIKFKGALTGVDTWSSNYSIVVAGFADNNYSIVQKALPTSSNGNVEVMLSNVSNEVKTIEFCITNKLRERILTFKSMEVNDNESDTILIDVGTIDIGMYSTIQYKVFNTTCIQCHGASTGEPAAGLYLTKGKSYNALVNKQSAKIEGGILVMPGEAEESVLHQALNPNYNLPLRFDHVNMISNENMLTLIDRWIDNGAKP